MRARLIFIVVAILLLAGFAALNWPEINRTQPLSFGVITSQAPLGLILLGLLVLTLAVFLISSATQEARYLMEHRRHAKALEAQRVLADTAEASRFTDLRQHLDTHLRENRQREAIAATEFEKSMVQSQRELRTQLEQMNHALTARLGEIESRIDSRLERITPVTDVSPRPADAPLRDRVKV
jgi:uncharacterized integral membrane protein